MPDKITISDIKDFTADWKIISASRLWILIHKNNISQLIENGELEKMISDDSINNHIWLLIKISKDIIISEWELKTIFQKIQRKIPKFKNPEKGEILYWRKNSKDYIVYRFRNDIRTNVIYWKEENNDMIFNEDNTNESTNRFLKHKFQNINSKIKFII